MNLSTVGQFPDMSSISAVLFDSNPAILAITNSNDGLGQQGGVRQNPPAGSRGMRHEAVPTPPPPSEEAEAESSTPDEE